MKLVQAWIEIHRDELMADWELAVNAQEVFKIEPLKYDEEITVFLFLAFTSVAISSQTHKFIWHPYRSSNYKTTPTNQTSASSLDSSYLVDFTGNESENFVLGPGHRVRAQHG